MGAAYSSLGRTKVLYATDGYIVMRDKKQMTELVAIPMVLELAVSKKIFNFSSSLVTILSLWA